jgi:hypothetical protein
MTVFLATAHAILVDLISVCVCTLLTQYSAQ